MSSSKFALSRYMNSFFPADELVDIEIENFDEELRNEAPYKPKYSRVKHMVVLNRTRPQTCDRGVNLYHVEPEKTWERKMKCANISR